MIVRTLEECRQSERRVVAENWESVRMLLKDDHMGFSFSYHDHLRQHSDAYSLPQPPRIGVLHVG